jgi:elongation factor 1-gamma
MEGLTLHVAPNCNQSRFAMNVLDLCNITFTLKVQTKKTMFMPEFKKLNPASLLPFLQTSESTGFSQGTAIARWAARKSDKLYGSNNTEKAEVDQWLETVRNTLSCQLDAVVAPVFGDLSNRASVVDKKDYKKSTKHLVKSLEFLDRFLKNREFLVGTGLTLADLCLVHELDTVVRLVMTPKMRNKLPNVCKYVLARVNSTECRGLLRPLVFADVKLKLVKYDLEKMAKEKKKAEEEAKKAKEEKKLVELNWDEPEKKKEPVFPPTKIEFNTWKLYVVNEKDKQKKMDYIWEHFEPEAWSFWKVDYDKLPSDNKILFEARNRAENFMSGCDSFRKHWYGVHCVLGEEGDYNIRGIWMWRGPDFYEPLKDHPAWEYNFYKKLDPSNPEDKEMITTWFTAGDQVNQIKLGGETLRHFIEFR